MRSKIKLILFSTIVLISISALIVFGLNSFNSPSLCSGQWTNCNNAFADNANRATASVTSNTNKSGIWNNYGFSIPTSAVIDNVIVRADFFASNVRGYMNVRVSGDGGNTYGPSHIVGGNTAEQTFLIDVTNDLSWTPSMLSNSSLIVNATCYKKGSGSNPTCRLDWVPVNVTYTPFDFSLSANPGSGTINQGTSTQSTVSVNLLGGISQNVNLGLKGCPSSTTCSLSASSGNPSYNSTLTINTTSSTPAGTHVIQINGTGDGKTRYVNFTLIVTDSQPLAIIDANPENGTAPLTVSFTGSVAGGNSPFTYFWNFTDGGTSTEQNPTHIFNNTGTYNVTFKVTDFDGDMSTRSKIITAT